MENRNKRKGKRQQQQQFKSARSSASTRVFFKVFFCACCCWNADNGKMQAPFMRGKKNCWEARQTVERVGPPPGRTKQKRKS